MVYMCYVIHITHWSSPISILLRYMIIQSVESSSQSYSLIFKSLLGEGTFCPRKYHL